MFSRLRGWGGRLAIAAAVAGLVAAAWYVAVPRLVERQVRRALRDAGFPDARFELADVGVGRVQLHDVVLADGLALGDVELDGSVTLLAGGRGPDRATIRGAHVTSAALEHLLAGGSTGGRATAGKPSSVRVVRVVDSELSTPAGPIAIDGTLALPEHQPFAIDAHAHLAAWQGARDVSLSLRGAGGALRACAQATIDATAVDGCANLPTSPGALRELHALDVSGTARRAGWWARGTGHLAWGDGRGVRLTGGHVHVDAPAAATRATSIGALAIDADVAGPIAPFALAVTGHAHADRLTTHAGATPAILHAVDLPFAVRVASPRGALAVSSATPLAITADRGALALGGRTFGFDHPRVVLRDAGAIPLASPVSSQLSIAWRGLDGAASLPIGAGELRVALAPHGPRVLGGHASLLGGLLTFSPAPRGVVIRARSLSLMPLLALVTRGRVTGTGRLDGEVAIGLDGGRASLRSFALSARGSGTLQVTDRDWKLRAVVDVPSLAIHRRIVAALADFSYAQLTLALRPPGSDPELSVTLHGRGRRVDQEIALALNLHNVRNTLGALR